MQRLTTTTPSAAHCTRVDRRDAEVYKLMMSCLITRNEEAMELDLPLLYRNIGTSLQES
jgi:hypothetical protein